MWFSSTISFVLLLLPLSLSDTSFHKIMRGGSYLLDIIIKEVYNHLFDIGFPLFPTGLCLTL